MSNLHPELTEKDIKELFSRIGEIKFAKLELNTRGQSTGVAFVGYMHPRDCGYAIEKFDGRRAAGQVISVENAVPLAERIFAASQRKPKKKNNRRKEKKRQPKHKKTAEELDAELSQYMSSEGQASVAQDTSNGANPADNDALMDEQEPANEQPASIPAPENAVQNAPQEAVPQVAAQEAAPQPADERFPAVSNGE